MVYDCEWETNKIAWMWQTVNEKERNRDNENKRKDVQWQIQS